MSPGGAVATRGSGVLLDQYRMGLGPAGQQEEGEQQEGAAQADEAHPERLRFRGAWPLALRPPAVLQVGWGQAPA